MSSLAEALKGALSNNLTHPIVKNMALSKPLNHAEDPYTKKYDGTEAPNNSFKDGLVHPETRVYDLMKHLDRPLVAADFEKIMVVEGYALGVVSTSLNAMRKRGHAVSRVSTGRRQGERPGREPLEWTLTSTAVRYETSKPYYYPPRNRTAVKEKPAPDKAVEQNSLLPKVSLVKTNEAATKAILAHSSGMSVNTLSSPIERIVGAAPEVGAKSLVNNDKPKEPSLDDIMKKVHHVDGKYQIDQMTFKHLLPYFVDWYHGVSTGEIPKPKDRKAKNEPAGEIAPGFQLMWHGKAITIAEAKAMQEELNILFGK